MATRYNYTGQLITDGLVLNLDAAKRDSYPGSGTTWYDLSGNGNNGTLTNGPTYTGVSKDAAIVFDGVDDRVNFTETDSLKTDSTSQFTREAWFNMIEYGSSNYPQVLWHKRTIIGVNGDINIGEVNEIYSNIGASYTGTGVTINLNTWYHAVVIYNNTEVKIYVNSSLKTTSTRTLENQDGESFEIGASKGVNEFKGKISNTKGYNRALSPFEIFQNFHAMKGRYGIPDIVTDGLVLNLDAGNPYSYLSGSSGTTWTDVSGNGNNGTLTNGASYENGAIVFDGVDDSVIVPSSSQFLFNTGDSITVESWVKCTNIDARTYQAFFTIGGIPSVDRDRLIQMRISQYTTYGHIDMLHRNSTNNEWQIYRTSDVVVTENEWIHVVGTLTYGNGSTWKIYINGVDTTCQYHVGNGNVDPIQPLDVSVYVGAGEDGGSFGEYFTGNISVSRLYQKALSAEEITQNFNALRGRYGI